MSDLAHESRCRISELKCVLSKAVAEYKPDGLTDMEAAVAFQEQANWWLKETWLTDCKTARGAGDER